MAHGMYDEGTRAGVGCTDVRGRIVVIIVNVCIVDFVVKNCKVENKTNLNEY